MKNVDTSGKNSINVSDDQLSSGNYRFQWTRDHLVQLYELQPCLAFSGLQSTSGRPLVQRESVFDVITPGGLFNNISATVWWLMIDAA
jgi:hypothetical protein